MGILMLILTIIALYYTTFQILHTLLNDKIRELRPLAWHLAGVLKEDMLPPMEIIKACRKTIDGKKQTEEGRESLKKTPYWETNIIKAERLYGMLSLMTFKIYDRLK